MKLIDYCKEKGISVTEFCKIVNISDTLFYEINKNPFYNIKIKLAQHIYQETKKRFGKGLFTSEYLDWKVLK